jgi:hypothetical protein
MAEEKTSVNPIRSLFEVVVLFAAIFIILGGLGMIIFFSPWSQIILSRFMAYDIGFAIQLGAYFVIAALIVLFSALTVYSRNIVHSALYLLGTFACVAALYIFLNATFLGVAQVLVYIGAVGVLILFAVMLTRKSIMEESHGEI